MKNVSLAWCESTKGRKCEEGSEVKNGGRVGTYTSTVTNLKPEVKECGMFFINGPHKEKIALSSHMTQVSLPTVRASSEYILVHLVVIQAIMYVVLQAIHSLSIAIRPEHANGHTDYTQITFLVYDQTDGVQWSKTYTLPATQYIKDVDAALEHNDTMTPNSLWKTFVDYHALDKNLEAVNLKNTFTWTEWPNLNMDNQHSESYYGGDEYASLNQRKTPGGGYLITSKSGTLSGTGNSYTFSVSGYSPVTVMMAGNENADFDLYAKWGSPPTTSDYDARGYSSTSLEYFTTSGSGTLYFMVRSYSGSGEYATVGLIF